MSNIATFRTALPALPTPLPPATTPADVLALLDDFQARLGALRQLGERLRAVAVAESNKLSADADTEAVADAWHEANIAPLLDVLRGDAVCGALCAYARTFAVIAELLPDWLPVATRSAELSTELAEVEVAFDRIAQTIG